MYDEHSVDIRYRSLRDLRKVARKIISWLEEELS